MIVPHVLGDLVPTSGNGVFFADHTVVRFDLNGSSGIENHHHVLAAEQAFTMISLDWVEFGV